MSQIETIMLVVLGVVVLMLGILLLGRSIWSVRSGKKPRRIDKSGPKTVSEIQAERDRLRAEYAVMSRKQEIQISSLKTKLTDHRAEVSRNKNKIDELTNELASQNQVLEARDSELTDFREVLSPIESQLAAQTASVQRLKDELRGKTNELERLTNENAGLRQREAKKDIAISQLEQRMADAGHGHSRVARNDAALALSSANGGANCKAETPEMKSKQKASQPDAAQKTASSRGSLKTKRTTKGRKVAGKAPQNASSTASPKRSKKRKVLSLAKRIRTLQDEVEK
jgi:uncharacterized coiled-coil protein SlyX